MASRSPVQTHYSVLKVSEDAPAEVIRAAYRSLSSTHHPDHNAQSPDAGKAMAAINRAYEVLSDPVRRQDHDCWIRQGRGQTDENHQSLSRNRAPVPVALSNATTVLIRYRRYWGGLAGAALMSAAAYAIVPIFDDRDGAWLEHAWQQAWRRDGSTSPIISVTSPAQLQPGEPPLDTSFGRGLNWETALKR